MLVLRWNSKVGPIFPYFTTIRQKTLILLTVPGIITEFLKVGGQIGIKKLQVNSCNFVSFYYDIFSNFLARLDARRPPNRHPKT